MRKRFEEEVRLIDDFEGVKVEPKAVFPDGTIHPNSAILNF